MEFIVVNFSQLRTVRSGGNAVGPSNQTLAINGGVHTLTLDGPQDYLPLSQRLVVAQTSVASPLRVTFTLMAATFTAKFPAAIFGAANTAKSFDAFLTALGPLGLTWTIERNGAFGGGRAEANFEIDEASGEAWVIAALDSASFSPHRHNSGRSYGELVLTLAGELTDITDAGNAIVLGPGKAMAHGPDTVHSPAATGFWAGLFYRPRGVTAQPVQA